MLLFVALDLVLLQLEDTNHVCSVTVGVGENFPG